jgi:4-hydroxybenzoate polyprenyl transferase
MRLDRPIGILLLLWPTLWALWIAGEGRPDPHVFLVFVAGVVLMRSAGCVMNDFADRGIDPHVERTRERPMARGAVAPLEALLLAAALGAVAFGLVLTLNRLTILLALAGAVLTIAYPFLKRITHLPQVWLGASFGWSVPMAFAAQTGAVPPLAWLMFIAVVLWAVVYDTMYAMVDREDDLKLGVRSTAILFGDADRPMIGAAAGAGAGGAGAGRPAGRARRPGTTPRWPPRGAVALAAVPDPRAPAGGVFPRLPEQQPLRHGGVCRHPAALHLRRRLSRAAARHGPHFHRVRAGLQQRLAPGRPRCCRW